MPMAPQALSNIKSAKLPRYGGIYYGPNGARKIYPHAHTSFCLQTPEKAFKFADINSLNSPCPSPETGFYLTTIFGGKYPHMSFVMSYSTTWQY